MGRELDSLADVISFGVAPVVIAYAAGMDGFWDHIVLVNFVDCGVSRLARYNIQEEVSLRLISCGLNAFEYFYVE